MVVISKPALQSVLLLEKPTVLCFPRISTRPVRLQNCLGRRCRAALDRIDSITSLKDDVKRRLKSTLQSPKQACRSSLSVTYRHIQTQQMSESKNKHDILSITRLPLWETTHTHTHKRNFSASWLQFLWSLWNSTGKSISHPIKFNTLLVSITSSLRPVEAVKIYTRCKVYLIQFWQGDLNDCESCTDIQPGLLSTATTLQNNVSAELTTGLKKKNTSDLMLVDLQMQKCLNMTNKFSNAVHLDHSCSGFTMNTQRAVVPWEWKSFRGRESPEYRQSRPCPDMRENMLKLRCRKRDSIYKWNRNRPCGEQCGAAGVYQWIWFQVVKIFAFTLKFNV